MGSTIGKIGQLASGGGSSELLRNGDGPGRKYSQPVKSSIVVAITSDFRNRLLVAAELRIASFISLSPSAPQVVYNPGQTAIQYNQRDYHNPDDCEYLHTTPTIAPSFIRFPNPWNLRA